MKQWLTSDDPLLQLEAVRTLRDTTLADRDALLWNVIENSNSTDQMRAEAIVGIRDDSNENINKLISLTGSEDQILAQEALRSLRGAKLDKDQQQKLEDVASSASSLSHLIARVFNPQASVGMPEVTDTDAWMKKLEGSADKAAGERIFFHIKSAGCARCHQFDGRGASVGPDLTTTARALDRRRLVESILQPSKEIAPQFVNWTIETKNGKSFSGIYLGEKVFRHPKTEVETKQMYVDATGKEFALSESEIDQREASPLSVMPNDLHKQMTLQEFRDLLAFLQNR
jgi:putative heme-binding domain-containing protein